MSKTHDLTGEHVLRTVYDSETEALKVELNPTELNLQLDHKTGDSIYAYRPYINTEVSSGQELDISKYGSFTIYFKYSEPTSVEVAVAPTQDSSFFQTATYTPVASMFNNYSLNAERLKVTFSSGQCFVCARV
jgi:hypothetical protein